MKKFKLYLLSFVLLLTSCNYISKEETSSTSKTKVTSFKKNIDSLLTSLEINNEFMGSVSIVKENNIIYQNTTGYENISLGKKANNETLYKIGSVSKMYTAVLILKAIEEGKLNLDQSINLFFPKIKNAKNITVKNLLNHSSGIPSYTKYSDFLSYHTKPKRKKELLELITQIQQKHYKGQKTEYSNSNYVLLTLIIENVYASTFKTVLNQKLKQPLSLHNTFYLENDSMNTVQSYKYASGWKVLPVTNLNNALGAGGIFATSKEVNKFLQALFNTEIINQKSLSQMITIEQGYGLGITKLILSGRECFGHHGEIDGFKTSAFYFPNEKLSITITSNASYNNIDTILTQLLKSYFNDPVTNIPPEYLEKFTGFYYNPERESEKTVFITENNKLVHVIKDEFKNELHYKGNRTFTLEQSYAEAMHFTFSEDGQKVTIQQGKFNGIAIKK